MSANRPQMFRRKPANPQQQIQNSNNESPLRVINKNTRLSYTNKICQVNIYPSPMKKSFEESLTYSIQLTPITSSQKKKLQNYKMMEVRKHLYGIQDNLILNEEINEEQSLLLDYKQILDDGKRQKIQVTPLTSCGQSQTKFRYEQQEAKQNICSNFQMYNTQCKVSFYHLNKSTIKVQYVPFKHETDKKQNNSLVARMRVAFYRQPLLLFDFIATIVQNWSEQTLKMFLISNSVKFTTQEIKILQQSIRQMSSSFSMHQVAQTLFILSNEQHQMLINSQKMQMNNLLPSQQNSFLKLYIAMIKENTTENLRQLLPNLESFFRKVI